jgi:hypothetical protein
LRYVIFIFTDMYKNTAFMNYDEKKLTKFLTNWQQTSLICPRFRFSVQNIDNYKQMS